MKTGTPSKPKIIKRRFVGTLEQRLSEDAPLIQVILGPRQVGKSTGVEMVSGFKGRTFYATADDALSHSSSWISEQWQAAKLASAEPILVLDEVQKVMQWSDQIKALWDAEKRKRSSFRLVLLGSSSLSLMRGLEESLAGRFEVISVPHWGLDESMRAFGYGIEEFLVYGGYPVSARFADSYDRWRDYLKNSIIETVIGKDIMRQGTVRKPALFRQAFELLCAYPAQEVSYNKLLGQLQDKGNTDLIKHYIELFEGAFLFKALHKYSGSKIRQKASSPKILPLCPALYSYQSGEKDLFDPEVRGHVFEAAVGAELAKLPGELYYWRDQGSFEVDFVYVQGREVIAVEVKSGRKKSARGMSKFLETYPKAKPLFVQPEHLLELSRDAAGFIARALG
jgi:predicted AAA+ superfamily ATPase